MLTLAGDIGGTKTLLQLARMEGETATVLHEASFSSQAYTGLESMVQEFLRQTGETKTIG